MHKASFYGFIGVIELCKGFIGFIGFNGFIGFIGCLLDSLSLLGTLGPSVLVGISTIRNDRTELLYIAFYGYFKSEIKSDFCRGSFKP